MADPTDHTYHPLWEMIKDLKFGMFTTLHSNGHLHARPMTTQNTGLDQASTLWFFMPKDCETVRDLTRHPAVVVAYADPGADRYVSVSGDATVSDDRAMKQQLWSPLAKAWFPQGVDDPSMALVGVRISHADYWDVKSNKLVQLFKMAKAAVTGERPGDLGQHGHVRSA